jgi:hypothetical protein
MSAPGVDVLDPDYCSFESVMERRQNYFADMRYLDELSWQLSRQADDELQRRLAAEPQAEREWREQREKTLAALVIRATAEMDPTEAGTLWAAVDAILADG